MAKKIEAPEIVEMKANARLLQKEHPTLSYAQCLEVLARSKGFSCWRAMLATIEAKSPCLSKSTLETVTSVTSAKPTL